MRTRTQPRRARTHTSTTTGIPTELMAIVVHSLTLTLVQSFMVEIMLTVTVMATVIAQVEPRTRTLSRGPQKMAGRGMHMDIHMIMMRGMGTIEHRALSAMAQMEMTARR